MRSTSSSSHPCGQCAFFDQSVWQPVGNGAMSFLNSGFTRREFSEGQALYQQGDENRGVFCVSRGLFAIRAHSEAGNTTLLKLAYPGEIIGFRSYLANDRHKTEARALVPSRVCTVAHRNANRLVHSDPKVLARLTARCVAEINAGRDRIIDAATESNQTRLARILGKLMQAHGTRDGAYLRMQLPLSRTDLADLLGIKPETVSRVLKRLKQDGEFVVSGRDIRMPIMPLEASVEKGIRSGRVAQ